jgi:hypothetical protein
MQPTLQSAAVPQNVQSTGRRERRANRSLERTKSLLNIPSTPKRAASTGNGLQLLEFQLGTELATFVVFAERIHSLRNL